MISKYIYALILENLYNDLYLYVGKHSWNGQGIDPNYKGSGKLTHKYKLLQIVMLEDLSYLPDNDFKEELNLCEHEWIDIFAEEFGISPEVFHVIDNPNSYMNFFGYSKDGILLNCHDFAQRDSSEYVWYIDDSNNAVTFGYVQEFAHCSLRQIDNSVDQFTYNNHWYHHKNSVREECIYNIRTQVGFLKEMKEMGKGFYGISTETRRLLGSKGAKTLKDLNKGIFGLTKEQRSANAKKSANDRHVEFDDAMMQCHTKCAIERRTKFYLLSNGTHGKSDFICNSLNIKYDGHYFSGSRPFPTEYNVQLIATNKGSDFTDEEVQYYLNHLD